MGVIKGQNLRIKLGGQYIAYATSCSVHTSASLEDGSTKDTVSGLWTEQEATSLSWDISCESLFAVGQADMLSLIGQQISVEFLHTSGAQNRVDGSVVCSGNAIISDINITAPNRQNVTWSLQAQGVGALNTGSTPSSSQI
jgi:hypothetical protein